MPRCARCHRRLCAGARCPADGWLADLSGEPAPAAPVGEVPGFELGSPLGAGGFAVVCAARQDGAERALKVALRADATTLERFRREAVALERIGPPAVPTLFASGQLDDGRPFLALERLAGPSLADYLADRAGPLELAELIRVADCIGAALARVHGAGYVHRDLKPENIFLRAQPPGATLIDFGLVVGREWDAELTRAGVAVGTAAYMAPEQLRAETVDARADIYALGVILYELATLRPPFVGAAAEVEHGHLALRPPRPRQFRPLPAELEEVILLCLAKDPARRPPLERLRACFAELGARARLPEEDEAGAAQAPTRTAIRTEGRRPVVLLCVETELGEGPMPPETAPLGGILARHWGDRRLYAFPGIQAEDPVPAALHAAETLVACGARAVLHLAGLVVRRGGPGAGPTLYGRDVDQPESWLPPAPWTGGLASADLARALPQGTATEDPGVPGFYRVGRPEPSFPVAGAPALVGRDALVERLLSGAGVTLRERRPRLVTVLGERGLGKTLLARVLEERLRAAHPSARLVSLRARRPVGGDPERLVRALLHSVLPTADQAVPADPRAYCRQALGERLGTEVWHGVAVALGWMGAQGAGVLPGRLRQDVVRAVGQGLQQQARQAPVVLLLDDAEWADDTTLDAIEHATREGEVPLWAAVLASPRLETARPGWGARAEHHDRYVLEPLDAPASRALARALLPAVEHPPAAVLDRLAAAAAGNPATMVETVHALEREGIIRRYPGSDAWYVATDELDRLPASPSRQWLAARELEAMPPELAELTRICAVLGPELALDEVEYVQRQIERHAPATTLADPAAGLTRLGQQRILVAPDDRRYAFREAAFQEACYELVAPAVRAELHGYAFAYWRSLPGAAGVDRLHRIAHHGARCGRGEVARTCYLALAAAARARHAYPEAEAMYTSALDLTGEDELRAMASILAERGHVRRRLTHFEDARADFRRAEELARRLDDRHAMVELLVAQSAICDFTQRYAEAAELVERAAADRPPGLAPGAEARLLNWLGVARFHQGRDPEAIEALAMAVALAEALGEHETQVGSMLILGLAFLRQGDRAGCLRVLDEAIDLCERTGDSFHLACALSNRVEVWREARDSARALQDLHEVIRIAHELDYAVVEGAGYANLAEHLLWTGDVAGALDAAERGHRHSEKRFRDSPLLATTLYYAQLLAHVGELERARAILASVRHADLSDPVLELTRAAIAAALGDDDASSWDAIVERARSHGLKVQVVEFAWLWGRSALRTGDLAAASAVLRRAAEDAAPLSAGMAAAIERDLQRALEREPGTDRGVIR